VAKKVIDCSKMPSDGGCTIRISGEEEEVVRLAALHAVDVHGHRDTPELRGKLRSLLEDERGGAMRV
jgi:predicted small metal-binding protein